MREGLELRRCRKWTSNIVICLHHQLRLPKSSLLSASGSWGPWPPCWYWPPSCLSSPQISQKLLILRCVVLSIMYGCLFVSLGNWFVAPLLHHQHQHQHQCPHHCWLSLEKRASRRWGNGFPGFHNSFSNTPDFNHLLRRCSTPTMWNSRNQPRRKPTRSPPRWSTEGSSSVSLLPSSSSSCSWLSILLLSLGIRLEIYNRNNYVYSKSFRVCHSSN